MSLMMLKPALLKIKEGEIEELNKLLPKLSPWEEHVPIAMLSEVGKRLATLIHRLEHRCETLASKSGSKLGNLMSDQRSEMCHAGRLRGLFPRVLTGGCFPKSAIAVALRHGFNWYPVAEDDIAFLTDRGVAKGLLFIGERARALSDIPGARHSRRAADVSYKGV